MSCTTGQCYCGAVSFRIESAPLWCGHCHCTICQRIHGCAFVTWAGFDEKNVELNGTENLKWYESTQGAARGSCDKCCSQLFFKSINWPGELHVARASLTSELELEPGGHSSFSSHVSWVTIADDLPRKD